MLLLLASFLVACEVDPLSNRPIPKLGTVYTSGTVNVKDIYTGDDTEDPKAGDRGIESAEPAEGSPAGGETVILHGWGFEKESQVFFGTAASPDVFYVNSKKLRVVTPAHSLGKVDVAVQWPDGLVRVLPAGFLYKTYVTVDTVEPAQGTIDGGTPLTITGSGFTEGLRLVVGTRLALNVEILDQSTIVAITPPGDEGGAADVIVSSPAGVVRKKDVFTYTVRPRIDGVFPATGPVGGGNTVEIRGKWLSPVTAVLFGEGSAAPTEVKNDRLLVTVPPGTAGYADVVVTGPWGWDAATHGYLYLASDPGSGLEAVVPDEGPESGGTIATLAGCDLPDGIDEVRFGTVKAPILGHYPAACAVVVEVPPGTGTTDVTGTGSAGKFTLKQAFTYLPTVTIDSVSPNVGPSEGGTRIRVTGSHFTPEVQVLVGPLAASDVEFVSENELEATTPPGSPGLADVTVVAASGKARSKRAFLYTVKAPEVWAITPGYGSRAGGTFLEILGAGFTQDAMVFVGDNMGTGLAVKSYGLIHGYSPPNAVGTYDLTVNVSVGQAVLESAFTTFDPTSWYGGTWGPPIDGAVNVTVIDAGEWGPLEGAAVILGSNPNTQYKGFTDSNGQVTLSGPGLLGPVDIHTTRKDYDAASIIGVGAENATLYLIPVYPPSTGPTEPVEPLAPGNVSGRVVGLGKYVVVPPGDCKNKEPGVDGLCAPCMEDSDCLSGKLCLPLGKSGKYCTRACTQPPAPGDGEEIEGEEEPLPTCPSGYMCAPVGTEGEFCTPSLGVKRARCELSTTSIYSTMYQDGFVVVDEEAKFKLNDTRLGEVAIICLGGWEDPDTLEFHPLAMGVKRHVNIAPGVHVADQNIWLNIPLTRSLRLRMDDPPRFEDFGGYYQVTPFLDFGSDGIFRLPGSFEGLVPEDVVLTSLPEALAGDIYDASYILYAGAYSATTDLTPYSNLLVTELTELDATSVARLAAEGFVVEPTAPADQELLASWTNDQGTFLVGGHGRVFRYADGTFYQLPSVVGETLRDLFGFPDHSLVAVGDNGAVVRYDGQKWQLLGSATDQSLRAVWGSDPDDLHAVGRHRIVSYYEGEWHEQKVSPDLTDVWGTGPDDVWAVGRAGTLFWYDGTAWYPRVSPTEADLHAVHAWPDGRLLVAGDGVAFLREGGTWSELGLREDYPGRRLLVLSADEFYLSGAPGEVAHWVAGEGFEYLPAPANLQVNDVVATASGELLALGTPALLLTPMIPFPIFQAPLDGGEMKNLLLSWTYDGNAEPISLHTVAITQKNGRSLWRLTVDGVRTQVPLPDFPKIINVNPLPAGEKRLRIYSAHSPEFSINAFDLYHLGTLAWKSWSYDMITFDE